MVRRVYAEYVLRGTTEESKNAFSTLAEMQDIIVKEFPDNYECHVVALHNSIRENSDLENKVFVFANEKDTKETAMIFFNMEPDGKCHKCHRDENGEFYIEIIEGEYLSPLKVEEWKKSKDKHYYRVRMDNGGSKIVYMCEEMVKQFYGYSKYELV